MICQWCKFLKNRDFVQYETYCAVTKDKVVLGDFCTLDPKFIYTGDFNELSLRDQAYILEKIISATWRDSPMRKRFHLIIKKNQLSLLKNDLEHLQVKIGKLKIDIEILEKEVDNEQE